MTERERYRNCMHYKEVDRIPYWSFKTRCFAVGTLDNWYKQGLPKDIADFDRYFNLDRQWPWAGIDVGLRPRFKEKVISQEENTVIVRDSNGVTSRRLRQGMSLPQCLDWTLKDRKNWEEFKKRLNPETPGRYPANWDAKVKAWKNRDYPLGIRLGSLYGWIRNWMGLQNISLLIYDDPDLFLEMVEHLTSLTIETIRPALEVVEFDFGHFWEDMAFANGPMISPQHFRKFLVPQYKRITSLLGEYGVDIISVDCDGDIEQLVQPWLESGVNCMFPVEVGTWETDPMKLRQRFGRELRMIGGIDKRVLASSKEAIRKELESKLPLVQDGGYIPTIDHCVPPNAPLENYKYCLQMVREILGDGHL